MSRFCINCGEELKSNASFCTNCGKTCDSPANAAASIASNANMKEFVDGNKKTIKMVGIGVAAVIAVIIIVNICQFVIASFGNPLEGKWLVESGNGAYSTSRYIQFKDDGTVQIVDNGDSISTGKYELTEKGNPGKVQITYDNSLTESAYSIEGDILTFDNPNYSYGIGHTLKRQKD